MAATSCSCPTAPDTPETEDESFDDGSLEVVMLLVCLTAFLLIFLFIVGPRRRRYRNIGPITAVVYTLSPFLTERALSLMVEAPFAHVLFPIWACFLLMVQLGTVDTFSTHSLENIGGWRSFYLPFAYQALGLVSSLLYFDEDTNISTYFITISIFLLMTFKIAERTACMELASKSFLLECHKAIADYMSAEHCNTDTHEVDPVSMKGYKYVVIERQRSNKVKTLDYRIPLLATDQEVITVEKVWDCKGWLLSSSGGDPYGHLKDTCLSFSLFRLLVLKYAGYSMPHQAHQKTWLLIQHGLVSSNDGNGHERVFRVIELELAFLFDLFYTKYPFIFHRRYNWLLKLFYFMITLAVFGTMAALLFSGFRELQELRDPIDDPYEELLEVLEGLVTVVVMGIYLVVEFLQPLFTYTSEWAQVIWLCNYVQRENWHGQRHFEKLLKALCSIRFFPWDSKLGQYSLVQCFSYRPPMILYNRYTKDFYDQVRDGQKEIAPTKLTEQVKKEVIRSLTANSTGYLRNGLSSLRRNGVSNQLSWACYLQTETQVIMVWHIATFFCEHEVPPKLQQMENFDTATKLSKYLAYLVAFAPRLLPDHPYVTQQEFDRVVIEARRFFNGCESLEERIQKLRYGDPMVQTVVGCAVRLGQQLVNQIRDPKSNEVRDGALIWRILAEFWAELALFVAPSDDVEAHLKHLALGGEFVTHLWALLYHAGIERAAPPIR